jgi:protein-disulfide isomerase
LERFIRKLSTVITFLIVYVVAAYSYLSAKGFEYKNGGFSLVKPAAAESIDSHKHEAFAESLPSSVSFNFNAPVLLGKADAPLTLYEFSSLGCSHCSDFHLNILPRLEKDFISKGKLNVVFINFPLEKKSMIGAMLFQCIPTPYRHNFLNMAFSNQRDWMLSYNADKVLTGYALSSGLNQNKVAGCLKNDATAQEIIATRQEAIDNLKIQGTPAFVFSGADGKDILYGVPNYEQMTAYLNNRLNRLGD